MRTQPTQTPEQLAASIAALQHSLRLATEIRDGKALGKSKRQVIRQLHHTDIRRSMGEEQGVSNPHTDLRHKRTMKIRAEHTGAQRMMRKRQRTIWAAEEELEHLIGAADAAYSIDFDAEVSASPSSDNPQVEGV